MRVFRSKKQSLYVWRNIQLVKSRVFLLFLLFVNSLVLFALDRYLFSSMGLIMVPISYVLGVYSYRSYLIWASGSEGEQKATNSLMGLDDSYCVLVGLIVPGNRGDIDHVVIGPNGIFVVEVKNYGGIITSDGDVWSKVRVIPSGQRKDVIIGSPSNQLKRNCKVLKDLILENKRRIFGARAPHIWIHGILVFTNPRAVVQVTNPTVDVVQVERLSEHIQGITLDYRLSQKQIDAMCAALLAASS